MADLDIVVTGLDPARSRSDVVSAIAARLGKSELEVDDMLRHVPVCVARATSEKDAQLLEIDLRTLGARVRYREPTAPAADAPSESAPKPLVYWSPEDQGYERPALGEVVSTPSTSAPAIDTTAPPTPPPILVKSSAEWFASGAPPLDASDPAAARFGRTSRHPRGGPDVPRTFFPRVGIAVRMPLAAPMRRGLAVLSLLGALAIGLVAAGLHAGEGAGPLLSALGFAATVGMAGLVLQIASACASATMAGEDAPSHLPGRLMQDYLAPGGLAVLLLGGLAFAARWGADELRALRATTTMMTIFWGSVTTYALLGLAVSAGGRSALGWLDVARLGRFLLRAPLETLTMLFLGAATAGAGGLGASVALALALARGTPDAIALFAGALGLPACALLGYGAGLVGALAGLLVRAKPAAWRDGPE